MIIKRLLKGQVSTHPGLRRDNNEDNFFLFGKIRENLNQSELSIEENTDADVVLAAVFDGMGGLSFGEKASYIAAMNIEAISHDELDRDNVSYIHNVNKLIFEEAKRCEVKQMGTTFVGAFFDKDEVIISNVGDSRCYLLRQNKLTLMSHDHSMGQRLVDMGTMTEEAARDSRYWHQLTQFLGVNPEEYEIEPHYTESMQICEGDVFLLCSDGLTDMLTDDQIEIVMRQNDSIASRIEQLQKAALVAGGNDNITMLMIEVNRMENRND